MRRSFAVIFLGLIVGACLADQDSSPQTILKTQKVNAGGHQLNMLIGGEGTPAVIFESGIGSDLTSWSAVQGDIARFATTVSYDRAGLGKSEPSKQRRTARQIALDLHLALQAAGIKPPYVLVGHSLGGILVRVFADMYSAEVAGMVLVDPSQEAFDDWLRAHPVRQPMLDPKGDTAEHPKGRPLPRVDESQEWATYRRQARAAKVPPGIPVILLTALNDRRPAEMQKTWVEKHEEWIAKVPRGRHIKVENSGHYIQVDHPQVVIDAVKEVVTQSRQP